MERYSSPAGPVSSAPTSFTTRSPIPPHRLVVVDKLTYAGSLLNLDGALPDPRVTFVQADIGDARCHAACLRGAPPARRAEPGRRNPRRSIDRQPATRSSRRTSSARSSCSRRRGATCGTLDAGERERVPLSARVDRRGVRHRSGRPGSSARRRRTRRTRRTRRARRPPITWCAPTFTPTACRRS